MLYVTKFILIMCSLLPPVAQCNSLCSLYLELKVKLYLKLALQGQIILLFS